ncbi:MAG: arsenate reductase (glutaredoxin) [Flavobacteriales bacterium]
MIIIYHNNRCRKSREAVSLLAKNKIDFEVIEYLKTPISENQLRKILSYLDINALELIRTNESDWKTKFKGKQMTEDELIKAMIEYPKLMERPIVVKGNRAVIARPAEKISKII